MRPLLVLMLAALSACESGIITILGDAGDKDPADLSDSFTHDATDAAPPDEEPAAALGDTADSDGARYAAQPSVRCFDMGGGQYDRILTAIVPAPATLDWTRVLPPRVLVWRAEETCWDGDATWSTGTEGTAGAHPDGSPGATYTLTVSTMGIACDVDLPITLTWAAELRTGAVTAYAATGDTEPRCT